MNQHVTSPHSTTTLLGHPKGLFLLFTTEMWERMSYYGLRGIFVLYLSAIATAGAMGWDMAYFNIDPTSVNADENYRLALQSNALSILGTYAMLVYITPVLGAWIADNIWGQRKSILVGGVLMMLGHFSLGTPHYVIAGFETEFFWLGLMLLVIGSGLFKPNISTMVGDLYEDGDKRREAAFSIFYMGISLGAILGYMVVGTIGEKVDYQYAFIAAGAGMFIGVFCHLCLSQKYLGNIGVEPSSIETVKTAEINEAPLTTEEKDRVKVIIIMSFFTIIFWSGFEQAAGAMNLFAKYNTDLIFLGWEMPASWLQSINPLLMIIFAPILATFWLKMGDSEPDSPKKFALGMFFLALGFLSMVAAAFQISGDVNAKACVLWLVLAYVFHTIGELCLSPVGLSTVTKLSPLKYASLLIGMWFVFIGLGNKLASEIGQFVGDFGHMSTFAGIAIMTVISGIVLWLLSDKLVLWMHVSNDKQLTEEEILEEEMSVIADHEGVKREH